MKNTVVLFIGLLLLNFTVSGPEKKEERKIRSEKESIAVFCTPDIFNLTSKWASEFSSLNPDIKVNVLKAKETSIAENFGTGINIGFISSEYSSMYNESMWNVVIGRDVIVMIFNSKNPFADDICEKGISLDKFAQIFRKPGMKNWGTLLDSGKNAPVNIYLVNDESISSGMAKLLGSDQITITGIKVENEKEVISSVQHDPYSIGICKIANIPDFNSQGNADGIKLLPIDKNGNGKIDYMERLYENLNVLSRGVWIGKYPKALYNNIYFVSAEKPVDKVEVEFLRWILTDGQQYLNDYGYSSLVFSERQSKVDLFNDGKLSLTDSAEDYSASKSFLVIPGIFIVIAFIGLTGVRLIKSRKAGVADEITFSGRVFNKDFVDIPLGLYYDKTHTWAIMEKDGMVRVGIDDFLQHITGPLNRVRMKNSGETVRKGKSVLSIIQNGKQLIIYAPISGTIKEQNKGLNTVPSMLNSSPYSDGWIYRIEPANWLKEIQFLFMGEKYKEWLQSEFTRVKEFFTVFVRAETAQYAHVLQDGGELSDGILEYLGPEVWEDFQTNFIDVSK